MRFQAPESLSEQIAQHLSQRIITGQLAPGERIQELKVAGELDVSRGSVREAMLILERRHLIEIFPRRGAVVAQLTPELVSSLYDIYIELLCMLGRKVLERWSEPDLTGVMVRVRELLMLIDSGKSFRNEPTERVIEAGFEVMRQACRMVDNPFLKETLENFKPAISRTYYVALESFRGELAEIERFFQLLASAVRSSDAAALELSIRAFGEHLRNQVLSTLRQTDSA